MVYKRYIKKRGKVYGPYIYESKRIGNKVISTYIGEPKKLNKNKIIIFIIGFSFIFLSILLLYFLQSPLTGKFTLQISPSYKAGENIKGLFKIGLKKGELIPIDSKIIIEQQGTRKEILLSQVVNANSNGTFYVENTEISGEGQGYGFSGEKTIYPDVFFKLEIYSEKEEVTETPTPTTPETTASTTPTEATPIETTLTIPETNTEIPTEETANPEIQVQETPATETTTETPATETTESSTPETPTGGLITGAVIKELEQEIQGSCSKDNPFTYQLEQGKTAKIKQGSLEIETIENKETKRVGIEDNTLNLRVVDNKVEVTTAYSITEKNFGSAFLQDETNYLEINLENLDIEAKQGNLKISLVYQDKVLAEISKEINVEPTPPEKNITEEEKITGIENITNITEINITVMDLTLIRNIPDLTLQKNSNYILNLEEYFINADSYFIDKIENITVNLQQNLLTITPDTNFTGERQAKIIALKENKTIESNLFNINVSESITKTNITFNVTNISIATIQEQAVIGKPVKWKKQVLLEKPEEITIKLPAEAENITVKKIIREKQSKEIGGTGEIEKTGEDISSTILTGKITAELKLERKGVLIRIWKNLIKNIRAITGFVVKNQTISGVAEETNNEIELILEKNTTEYEISYETEAPQAFEQEIEKGKRITITGPDNLDYENVLAFTELPKEVPAEVVKLYHIINKTINGTEIISREEVNITKYDTNNNSLVDYIEWVVPHLSNQTYELEINIINIKSYPQVGKNWIVMFNTTGKANLKITAFNTTNWSNVNEEHDLKFLEVRCGDKVLEYEWIDNGPYNSSVFIQDYECNETGFEISKVLTTGFHNLEFDFGGIKAYAYNTAGTLNLQIYGALNINYNTSMYLKVLSQANSGFDVYDMEVINPPNNYSEFYSNISSGGLEYHLAIDSWNDTSNPRTLYLIYNFDAIAGAQTGTITFVWDGLTDANFTGNFTYYGNNSNYTIPVNSVDMRGTASYSASITSQSNLYVKAVIKGYISPTLNITYPINTTYNTITHTLNYTFNASNPDKCWWSNSSGVWNSTPVTCGINWTGLTAIEGSNTWTVYINDTSGIQNSSSVTFSVDSTAPIVTILSPTNITYATSSIQFNFSLNEAGSCMYSLNAGQNNYTMTANASNTGFNATSYKGIADGSYIVRAYCNDTAGNKNYTTTVTFSKDTTAPIITIISPVNNSNINTAVTFNVSLNEAGSWCGLSISGTANVTMTLNSSSTGANYTNSSIADGSYTFIISCNDTVNNFGYSSTYNFYVDTVYPQINFTSPTPYGTINYNSIFVNVTANDSASNISTFINFDNSLVAWWRMDDTNGSANSVVDYMGINNGTAQGNAVQTAGKMGKGFSFGGSSDYISTSLVLSENSSTFGGWIKWAKMGGANDYPISDGDTGDYVIARVSSYVLCADTQTETDYYTVSVNTWYQVFCVHNSTDLTLYVNGINRSTVASTQTPSANTWVIGGVGSFNGTIDDVLIFNRSLSASEISALYNATASQYSNNFTGLADGSHTFTGYAVDLGGNVNTTGVRSVTVQSDATYPIFSNYYDNNATLVGSGTAWFNVTVANTNGTVGLTFNETNYTASNLTSNVYNVSISLSTNGTYNYTWFAYGNGTNHLYNNSQTFSYSVLVDTNISSCGNLDTAGRTYTLAANLIPTGSIASCLNITAQNITLDCAGFWISNTTLAVSGIYSNQINTTIRNCNVTMGSGSGGIGVYLVGANNSYVYNCNLNGQRRGIYLLSTGNIILDKIITNSNTLDGIILVSSLGNTLTNITANLNPTGIKISTSSNNNTLTNITANSNAYGIEFSLNSNNNSLNSITANSNTQNGIIMGTDSNNIIKNSNFSLNTNTDVYLGLTSSNNTFLNCSYDSEYVASGSQLIRKWYYQAYVSDTKARVILNANITAFNRTGGYEVNLSTNELGLTGLGAMTEYVNNGTRNYYSNYTIYAGKSGYFSANHSFNLTGNTFRDEFSLLITDTTFPLIEWAEGTAVDYANVSRNWIYANISFSELNFENISFTLYNSSGTVNSTIFTTATYNINWTNLSEGNYTYIVNITDIGNNQNSTSLRHITLDRTAPNVSFSCSPSSVSIGGVVTCSCAAVDNLGTVLSYVSNPPTVSAGSFTATCTASDAAGNSNSANSAYSVEGAGSGPGGGGTGGAGGTGERINVSVVANGSCLEHWECTWSECNSFNISSPLVCRDLNNCGTNRSYPGSKICGELTPLEMNYSSWTCGEWGECQMDYSLSTLTGSTQIEKKQIRECTEIGGQKKEIIKRDCYLFKSASIKKATWCEERYIEIYDNSSGQLVGMIKETSSDKKNVDISFVFTNATRYCAYCFDGIKDYDETGLDCGGVHCPVCFETPKKSWFNYRIAVAILWAGLLLLLAYLASYFARTVQVTYSAWRRKKRS